MRLSLVIWELKGCGAGERCTSAVLTSRVPRAAASGSSGGDRGQSERSLVDAIVMLICEWKRVSGDRMYVGVSKYAGKAGGNKERWPERITNHWGMAKDSMPQRPEVGGSFKACSL